MLLMLATQLRRLERSYLMQNNPNDWRWAVGGLIGFCLLVSLPFLRLLGVL